MKRKLSRSGNGWSVFLPKVIIELLELEPEKDEIDLSVVNKILIIKKFQDKKQDKK